MRTSLYLSTFKGEGLGDGVFLPFALAFPGLQP